MGCYQIDYPEDEEGEEGGEEEEDEWQCRLDESADYVDEWMEPGDAVPIPFEGKVTIRYVAVECDESFEFEFFDDYDVNDDTNSSDDRRRLLARRKLTSPCAIVSKVGEVVVNIHPLHFHGGSEEIPDDALPPRDSGKQYIRSGVKFHGAAIKQSKVNRPSRFNETKFILAITEALNGDRQACKQGETECKEEYGTVLTSDVDILLVDQKGASVQYQVEATDANAPHIASRLLHPYFYYPLSHNSSDLE